MDHVVTRGFVGAISRARRSPSDWVRQMLRVGESPDFAGGRYIHLPSDAAIYRQSVELADAVVLLSGAGATATIGDEALKAGKPVLPLPATGGDAEALFDRIVHRWDREPGFSTDSSAGAVMGDRELIAEEFQTLDASIPGAVDRLMELLGLVFGRDQPDARRRASFPQLEVGFSRAGHSRLVDRLFHLRVRQESRRRRCLVRFRLVG